MKLGCFCCCGLAALMGVAGCNAEKKIITEPQSSVITQSPEIVSSPVPFQEVAPVTQAVPSKPVAQAQPAEPTPVVDAAEAPTLTFKEVVHDFGAVGPSSSNACEFTFTNTGKGILKIERFHSTCGCTIPEMEKKEYAPGESGVVKVRYNASVSAATVSKPIYVYSNDPRTPQLELMIKAKIQVNVSISPETVSLLLDQDNGAMPKLTLRSTDGKEFSITSITVTNEAIDIPFDPSKKATEFILDPKIHPDKLESTVNGVIQVHTDHPQSGILMVRFDVKPFFEVSRPRIILQNVLPGEEVVRDVWIRSNYDKKVEIESFSSTNGTMTIESQKEDGNHLQIMVKITLPTDAPASNRRYITDELKIKLKDGNEVSVRCSGWFKLQ